MRTTTIYRYGDAVAIAGSNLNGDLINELKDSFPGAYFHRDAAPQAFVPLLTSPALESPRQFDFVWTINPVDYERFLDRALLTSDEVYVVEWNEREQPITQLIQTSPRVTLQDRQVQARQRHKEGQIWEWGDLEHVALPDVMKLDGRVQHCYYQYWDEQGWHELDERNGTRGRGTTGKFGCQWVANEREQVDYLIARPPKNVVLRQRCASDVTFERYLLVGHGTIYGTCKDLGTKQSGQTRNYIRAITNAQRSVLTPSPLLRPEALPPASAIVVPAAKAKLGGLVAVPKRGPLPAPPPSPAVAVTNLDAQIAQALARRQQVIESIEQEFQGAVERRRQAYAAAGISYPGDPTLPAVPSVELASPVPAAPPATLQPLLPKPSGATLTVVPAPEATPQPAQREPYLTAAAKRWLSDYFARGFDSQKAWQQLSKDYRTVPLAKIQRYYQTWRRAQPAPAKKRARARA